MQQGDVKMLAFPIRESRDKSKEKLHVASSFIIVAVLVVLGIVHVVTRSRSSGTQPHVEAPLVVLDVHNRRIEPSWTIPQLTLLDGVAGRRRRVAEVSHLRARSGQKYKPSLISQKRRDLAEKTCRLSSLKYPLDPYPTRVLGKRPSQFFQAGLKLRPFGAVANHRDASSFFLIAIRLGAVGLCKECFGFHLADDVVVCCSRTRVGTIYQL